MVYLTTVYFLHRLEYHRMKMRRSLRMTSHLKMWKIEALSFSDVLFQHLPGETEENSHKNLNKALDRDSDRIIPVSESDF